MRSLAPGKQAVLSALASPALHTHRARLARKREIMRQPLLGILLTLFVCLTATACGQNPETESPSAPEQQIEVRSPTDLDSADTESTVQSGEAVVSARKFTQVAGASYDDDDRTVREVCALAETGEIECWIVRDFDFGGVEPGSRVVPGPFVQVEVSWAAACGLRSSGSEIECWRIHPWSQLDGGVVAPDGGSFVHFGLGQAICVAFATGEVGCAGLRGYSRVAGDGSPPAGEIIQVSIYDTSPVCAVTEEGETGCWLRGGNSRPQTDNVPKGRFTQVTVGRQHACAIQVNRLVVCWGGFADDRTDTLESITAPKERFVQISADNGRWSAMTCGITSDGRVVCWDYERIVRPFGNSMNYVHVDAWGDGEVCAVESDGRIHCRIGGSAFRIGQRAVSIAE